jgi:5-formyltetrahydrofolate cyclo-ligase
VPVPGSKSTLRDQLKPVIYAITHSDQSAARQSICPHLLADPAIHTANTILAYASFGNELSLDPFINDALKQGKRVAIPAIDWTNKAMAPRRITNLDTDLTPARYDIRVPAEGCPAVEPEQIDVILLPGLAFDRAGNRLGRGAGFYDRYINALKESGHNPTLIGVCYHAQIVESVPTDSHDHRVDRVITELGPLDPV